MKKVLLTLLLLVSPFSFAQEATGRIEEMQICSTGEEGWVRTLNFKVDGKWFGILADYYGSPNDNDNNLSTSMLFMAYSQNSIVKVRATGSWSKWSIYFTKCGIDEVNVLHRDGGDYLRLSR